MSPKIVDRMARQRQVLAAASGVFARYGYRRATIEQVAEAAGIAKGSVYLSFATKEDLFYALFEQLTRESLSFDGSRPEVGDQPALARVAALFRQVARMLDANPALIPLTLEFWSACGVEETRQRFGGRFAALFAEFRALLVGLMEEGAAKGEVAADLPFQAVASCLIAMVDGLLVQQWTAPENKASTVLNEALPYLLRSLAAAPPAASEVGAGAGVKAARRGRGRSRPSP